jgi:hypothetical protein
MQVNGDDDGTEEQRLPIQEVLPDLRLHSMPTGWSPVEAFVLIKALDEDGDPRWLYRTTKKPNPEELLGALTVQVRILERELAEGWESD